MKFNKEMGKQLHQVAIGVTKNTGQGTDLMAGQYNGNLRNKPPDPEKVHLERRNKILEHKLKLAQKR